MTYRLQSGLLTATMLGGVRDGGYGYELATEIAPS